MRIAIVGSGYVGLVAAACFAELGHQVACVDNDAARVAQLNAGQVPIHEEFLPELLARHRGDRLRFTEDLTAAVREAAAVFIAVGTPPQESGHADLSYVEDVARDIARALQSYTVIVEKSTVPVLTSERIRAVMQLSGVPREAFDVVSNPEFLREGTAVTDFLYPDRIVVGSDNERATGVLRQIYGPLTSGEYHQSPGAIPRPDGSRTPGRLIVTSAKSAELIKHASNAFLAMKVSFINAVANMCEAVGADVSEVCAGIGSDSRIGERFLRPGIGYGGSCFPKDLAAFRAIAADCGCDFRLLDEVTRINQSQRDRFLRKVRKALWNLKGKRLGVLGLAFKGGTDDVRESPAITILEALLAEGCRVTAYDPAAMERAKQVLNGSVRYADDAYEAAREADALLVLTDWEEFSALDLGRLRDAMKYPVVLDGRNLFSPQQMAAAGFHYSSVGRPDVMPKRRAAVQRKAG